MTKTNSSRSVSWEKFRQVFFRTRAFYLAVIFMICSFGTEAQTYTKDNPFMMTIDVELTKGWLKNAPMELTDEARTKAIVTDLPLPGGNTVSVRVVKSLVAPQKVYDRLPEFMTYSFQGIEDLTISGRLTLSPKGLEVFMFTPQGDVYVEAESYGSAEHKVYYIQPGDFPHGNDVVRPEGSAHKHLPNEPEHDHNKVDEAMQRMMMSYAIGAQRREFRMHVIADKEYSVAVCGASPTRSCVEMAILTALNGMNALYVRDMSVKLNATANQTIYLTANPATFAAAGGASNPNWIQESLDHHLFMETNMTGHGGGAGSDNPMVPRASYDVGHLFSGRVGLNLGGGGVASLQSVCNNDDQGGTTGPQKAGGGSGVPNPQGSGWVNLLAHEFTHQFNADHTWSGNAGNCTPGQWSGPPAGRTSYEPGGGSTIVSYSDICAPQNIPNLGNIDYYHTISIKEVDDYIESGTVLCETNVASGNSVPVPSTSTSGCTGNYNLPVRTPFEITGSATDANDPASQLTYCWEQFNKADAQHDPITAPTTKNTTNGIYPILRSRYPVSTASRTFPALSTIASGKYNGDAQTAAALTLTNWQGELLPEVAGDLTLRLTVRDNNTSSGGVEHADVTINVVAGSPFAVTAPNTATTIAAGTMTNVTWDKAGTDGAPFNHTNVAIKLSIDGGLTYPITLAASTANDGAEMVNIPTTIPATTKARVRVEAGNECFKFFDISNADFTITSNCTATTNNICPTAAMAFDAGNAGLNLSLSNYFGAPVTSHVFNLNAGSMTGELATATVANGTTCAPGWGTEKYEVLDFAVSTTGEYSFSEVGGQTVVASIFLSVGFNPAMPCAGTFLGSNAFGNGTIDGISSAGKATLTACTTYKMVVWTVNDNVGMKTFNLSGPGSIFAAGGSAPANTGYTYVAVNTANSQVAAQSATADFTALAAGSYKVYGASYKNGGATPPANANPAGWVGQTVAAVTSSECVVFSSNGKSLTVNSTGCTPPAVAAPTVTQPTCGTPTGTIVVNATSANAIEYSINNGTSYQASNTFSGLAAGSYNIKVRETATTTCMAAYTGNPVVLNAPTGCGGCTTNLSITNQLPIAAGTYHSMGELTSNTSSVAAGTSVIFKSDTGVTLSSDFTVELNGIFEVLIEACP